VSRAAWIADYVDPVTFLDLFLSDAGVRNDAGYNNPDFDKLVKDRLDITDPKSACEPWRRPRKSSSTTCR
jgi:oligopeptide transport system substrate-binding protein